MPDFDFRVTPSPCLHPVPMKRRCLGSCASIPVEPSQFSFTMDIQFMSHTNKFFTSTESSGKRAFPVYGNRLTCDRTHHRYPISVVYGSAALKLSFETIFVHDGIKIPSRTIVLQAWVSSVVSPILNMGFFPNALS